MFEDFLNAMNPYKVVLAKLFVFLICIILGCIESYLNSCHDNSELEVGIAVLKELLDHHSIFRQFMRI